MMNSLFNLFAPFTGNTRHRARMQRNQCFTLPPFTRQYRRSTAAGYGYLQWPPIHHGRHDKRTQVRRIHRIAQFHPSFRRFKTRRLNMPLSVAAITKYTSSSMASSKQATQPNLFSLQPPIAETADSKFPQQYAMRAPADNRLSALRSVTFTRTCQ